MKYYSGTAIYSGSFDPTTIGWKGNTNTATATINFDSIYNMATVKVNGIDCGTLWTPPYYIDIKKALKNGRNNIEIEVTNTWHNRLIGDNLLPPDKRLTWTTAPFRLKNKSLLPAGLVGEVKLIFK